MNMGYGLPGFRPQLLRTCSVAWSVYLSVTASSAISREWCCNLPRRGALLQLTPQDGAVYSLPHRAVVTSKQMHLFKVLWRAPGTSWALLKCQPGLSSPRSLTSFKVQSECPLFHNIFLNYLKKNNKFSFLGPFVAKSKDSSLTWVVSLHLFLFSS